MPPAGLAQRIHAIQNAAEVIAQSLREMICEAELPPGAPLVQERLAEIFQVSRVPVRDALQLLIGMGVAVAVPRRGVIVRPLSRKHLDDLFEVRKILEGAAIRLAVRHAAPALLDRLSALIRKQVECLRRGDVKRHARHDDEFHEALYGAVGNERLLELVRANWEMIRQARCASVVLPKHGKVWIAASIERHRRILAALRGGNAEAAVSIVFENIESSKREITGSLREMGWIEGAGEAAKPSGEDAAARRPIRAGADDRTDGRPARRINGTRGGA